MCSPDASLDIFESFSKSNNFWVSDIYANRVEHVAYDSHGVIIDKFTQKVPDYAIGDIEINYEDSISEAEVRKAGLKNE